MTILGNLLLIVATLATLGLLTVLFGKEPRGGDALMGYGWSLIFLYLIFTVSIILAALIIGSKGGFAWIASNSSTRFLIVSVGLLSVIASAALSGFFKYEPGPVPPLIRFYSSFAPFLFPLILVAMGFILLNTGIRDNIPLAVYKWPITLVSALGIIGSIAAVGGFISESSRNQSARIKDMETREDSNHQNMLREIDTCDVMKNMVFILVLTDANQHPDIREKAVAKIKTHPEWQQELIARLQTDWAPEVFNFLASNDVENPDLFAQAVHDGVLIQARLIRERIRNSSHSSHFYPDLFSWEVERAVRTVDKFDGMGIDYRPAIKDLRAALEEPSEYDKPKFNCASLLDNWIKKHP